jgi:hypothetical protein
MRKAQAIPEVSGMWVSLVFILVVFMIILGTLAAFPGISDWFSDFFTIPEPTGQDYLIAKQSTEALQCAINSVALGQEWESCWDDFKPGSAGNLGLACLAAGTTVEDGMVKDGATIT